MENFTIYMVLGLLILISGFNTFLLFLIGNAMVRLVEVTIEGVKETPKLPSGLVDITTPQR